MASEHLRRRKFVGKRFGRLVVLEDTSVKSGTHINYICICDCGKYTIVDSGNLGERKSCVNSCGCLRREYAIAWGKAQTRENNSRWKGGITPERKRLRDNESYKLWRTSVFRRDKYTCQSCGYNDGKVLRAHHIENFATCIDKRYDVKNGITLCQSCHEHFHRLYTNHHNDYYQLCEFLSNDWIKHD